MESSRGVIGVDGSSFTVEEPAVESWAVVLPDEYEVERVECIGMDRWVPWHVWARLWI